MSLQKKQKVFGIGFQKTGTTSLENALSILGYRVCGPFGLHSKDIANMALSEALEMAKNFDAFQDNPWPMLFSELDNAYPGSKFVLTIRDHDKWFESVEKHFGTESTPMREWIYGFGSPIGNRAAYINRYNQHNNAVFEYFSKRPDD